MKASELRGQSVEELQAQLEGLVEESFNLRFQHTLGQLGSPIRLRHVRRDIARLRTLLGESHVELPARSGDRDREARKAES